MEKKLNPYEVALFDLDGTLADTIPALKSVFTEFLRRYSIDERVEEFSNYNGTTILGVCERLRERHALVPSVSSLFQEYNELLDNQYSGLKPFDGAAEVLRQLQARGVRLGLVTSSTLPRAKNFLATNQLTDLFEIVVAADEKTKGKPDPELYLRALAAAKVSPANAFAVEDSANGLAAARAAGILAVEFLPGSAFAPNRARSYEELHSLLVDGFLFQACNDLKVRAAAHEQFRFDPQLEGDISQLWGEAKATNPHLSNGKIFQFRSLAGNEMTGNFIDYKYYYAKKRGGGSLRALPIIPVGVSGLICSSETVLFARRSDTVTAYRGFWELIPSGGLDETSLQSDALLDARAQLRTELSEELYEGDMPEAEYLPLAVIFDFPDQTIDLAFQIRPRDSLESIIKRWKSKREYTELKLVNRSDLPSFIAQKIQSLVPTSLAILKAMGWHSP